MDADTVVVVVVGIAGRRVRWHEKVAGKTGTAVSQNAVIAAVAKAPWSP